MSRLPKATTSATKQTVISTSKELTFTAGTMTNRRNSTQCIKKFLESLGDQEIHVDFIIVVSLDLPKLHLRNQFD